jgi:IS30 family transposase
MARFVNAQVSEVVQPFWAALQAGEFIADAAVAAGTYRKQGTRWVATCGGARPRRGRTLKGRCVSFAEREEIALAHPRGEKQCAIARRLGRSPSTVSRELKRHADRDGGCRATTAHARAFERASRPNPAKLATNPRLRQIVQGRSAAALLARADRRSAAPPVPRRPGDVGVDRKNRIPDMVNIAQRPPEADDRRVPGHWEGDLLIGKRNTTAIATLVERASGFAMLVPLPDGYKPEHVAPALARKVQTLPEGAAPLAYLGPGAGDARLEADPRRRPHRGLLLELDTIADELNERPRKRLGFANPTERLTELLLQ